MCGKKLWKATKRNSSFAKAETSSRFISPSRSRLSVESVENCSFDVVDQLESQIQSKEDPVFDIPNVTTTSESYSPIS